MNRQIVIIVLIFIAATLILFLATLPSTSATSTEPVVSIVEIETTIPVEIIEPTEPVEFTEPIATLSPEEILWQERAEEYPVATTMWRYMKDNFGWSDEACAGIIGNVMAETGARTLDIPFKEYKKGPFGLFQWTKTRHKKVVALYGYDATIEEQLEFVYDELYGTDGVKQQVKDHQRELILNAKTASKAAKRFCDWFERPNGKGTIRQKYAKIAYEYFTSEGA